MPTQKKGCDDDEIVGLFSPQRRLFRKSKAAVLFRAKVSYRLMYILHESAMTPTHSSLGILSFIDMYGLLDVASSKKHATRQGVPYNNAHEKCIGSGGRL